MKDSQKLLAVMFGIALSTACVALPAHAQEQQTTTTESTTTTTDGMAPAPPMEEPRPGFADFGYKADNFAAHRGYNEGYNKGISDRNTGHSFRYKDDNSYRHPMGYQSGPISHSDYDRIYREAYVHGYEKGYRSAR